MCELRHGPSYKVSNSREGGTFPSRCFRVREKVCFTFPRFPYVMSSLYTYPRRVCPGKTLAEDILWLAIAQFLSVYTAQDPNFPPPRAIIHFWCHFVGAFWFVYNGRLVFLRQPLPFKYKLNLCPPNTKLLLE